LVSTHKQIIVPLAQVTEVTNGNGRIGQVPFWELSVRAWTLGVGPVFAVRCSEKTQQACNSGQHSFSFVDTAPPFRAQFSTMLKKILIGAGVVLIALLVLVVAGLYVYPKAQIVSATQQIAPDFTLKDATGKDFNLAAQHGRRVVLFFYRGYW